MREVVMELLRAGRHEELQRLVVADCRTVRPLLGRLWDGDPEIRRTAAWALGELAASHPDLGTEVVRRLMWALNDESGTNGVYGLAALGEIGRRVPEVLLPFLDALSAMAWDDGLRLALIRAFSAAALGAPAAVREQLICLGPYVNRDDDEEVAALQELEERCQGGKSNGC